MLSFQFNDKTVIVSDKERDGLKNRLAAGAQYDVLTDREKRMAIELCRSRCVSELRTKLIRNAESERNAAYAPGWQSGKTPDEVVAYIKAVDEKYAEEIARISNGE
jgi:hypothetical protein